MCRQKRRYRHTLVLTCRASYHPNSFGLCSVKSSLSLRLSVKRNRKAKMKGISILLAVASFVVLSHAQDPHKLDMFGLINVLYWKADANRDGTITKPELEAIWNAFDQNGDKIVTPAEFIPSWGAVTTMTHELSKAYFFLADIDDSNLITASDLDLIYQRFDCNGDGRVSAEEFNLKWQQLYREAPFAVLYLRADENRDDDLQRDEFPHLFSSFSPTNGSVTKAEFVQGWTTSDFGTASDAGAVFSKLDSNHDNVLTNQEVAHLFPQYDLSHNGKIELMELVEMSKLIPSSTPCN